MKVKKSTIIRVTALLCLVCVLAGGFVVPSAAQGIDLRYNDGVGFSDTLSADELLGLAGFSCTPTEAAYLDQFPEYSLTFNSRVPSDKVSLSGLGDTVTVTAKDYSYTALNGVNVRWIPYEAVMEGKTLPLSSSDGTFSATFTGLDNRVQHLFTVNYKTEFSVPAGVINEIAARAYNDGSAALVEQNAYEVKLAAYKEALKKYEDYCADSESYRKNLELYNQYLKDVDTYNAANAKWEKYLEDYETYKKDLKKYEDYVKAVADYEKAKKEYDDAVANYNDNIAAYKKYLEYVAKTEEIMKSLTALESAFVNSSEGHQLYATLCGDTVKAVVDNKDQLANVGGVSMADIDNASNSTDVLIELLTAYNGLQTNQEKFNWYKENYSTLLSRFQLLYSSISSIYKNSAVRLKVAEMNRAERMCQFIAHLYMISTGLDDSAVADTSWSIHSMILVGEGDDQKRQSVDFTLGEILESEYFLEDNNDASPASLTWPTVVEEVKEPIIPATAPQYPTPEVIKPIEPKPVTKPTPPAVVSKPTLPAEVKHPGDEPKAPERSAILSAVMNEVAANKIASRNQQTADLTVPKTASVVQSISPGDVKQYPVITFLDYEGKIIDNVTLRNGVLDKQVTTSRPADDKTEYTFIGWVTYDGTSVDFKALTENTTVYPSFRSSPRKYVITWITGNGTYYSNVGYGTVPVYAGSTEKPSDADFDYRFIGWSPALAAVSGDAVYTAEYAATERMYKVTWSIGDSVYVTRHKRGETPVCPVDPESLMVSSESKHMEFGGWDKAIEPVSDDTTYTAIITTRWTINVVEGESGAPSGLEMSSDANEYLVNIPMTVSSFDITNLLALAKAENKNLVFSFENRTEIEIPAASLSQMPADAVTKFSFDSSSSAALSCVAGIKTANGLVAFPAGTQIRVDYHGDENITLKAIGKDANNQTKDLEYFKQGSSLVFVTDGSTVEYSFNYYYQLPQFISDEGSISSDVTSAKAGDTVKLNVTPSVGYRLSSLVISFEVDGKTEVKPVDLKSLSFIMPAGIVGINAIFEKTEYTVSFYVDGVLYSSKTYHHGDKLEMPESPSKAQTKEEAYTFSGWSPTVISVVTEDAEYYAEFKTSQLAKDNEYFVSPHTTYLPWPIIIAAVVVLAVIAGGITLICVHIRRRHRHN